jgi:nitric oxide reductase NorD protein
MLTELRKQLDSAFTEVDAVFADCMVEAQALLSAPALDAYIDSARFLGKMGRGVEPILIFLQSWPQTARIAGEAALPAVMSTVQAINRSPNGRAIAPFLQSLPSVARRLPTQESLQQYMDLALQVLGQTSGSIHGIHKTYASPCLIAFFDQAPQVLQSLSMDGMRIWAEYGVRHYSQHPEQQQQYFALQSSDSRAVLQRERHGTLFVDQLRKLDLYLLALWQDPALLVPYTSSNKATTLLPYYDELGMRLPDVYDDTHQVTGLDRYRAALAHMAAHRRWSSAIHADNYSPAQRLTIECFEDARVDALALRRYPGLRPIFLALNPAPAVEACNPLTHSCLRHRLSMLAHALLCAIPGPWPPQQHAYKDSVMLDCVGRWSKAMDSGISSSSEMAELAIAYLAKTRCQSDQLPTTWFADSQLDYRDDNRHLWKFHELSDDEESFDTHRQSVDTQQLQTLPPRHYAEWDYLSQSYRPDWVSLFEGLHPAGQASHIDQMLDKHQNLVHRLKRMLDLLKPHERVRLRYQEEGSELDLDVAVRACTDLRARRQPDVRIYESQRSNGRSIAVTLLLDLSESLNDKVPGSPKVFWS